MCRLIVGIGLVFLLACSNSGGAVNLFFETFEDAGGTVDVAPRETTITPDVPVEEIAFELEFDLGAEIPFTECDPGDGCFLDKCQENADCQSKWCVEHMGDAACTMTCHEECPPGWSCKQVAESDPDVVYICVSNHANLCRPCATNTDCKSPGGAEDVCISYGEGGNFCGGACDVGAGGGEKCPWGFSCQSAFTVDGVELTQCINDAGVCPCTDKSVQLGLNTPCVVENEWGSCAGKRVCTEEGLSPCDAPMAVVELCNGEDDNCDGDVDEPVEVEGKYAGVCDDGNDCTDDLCNGEEGCEQVGLQGDECKDGNPCTVADHCEQGVCVGSPVACDDSNHCTDDSCDETGGCVFNANTLPCDDGDACTLGDECEDGDCVGIPTSCDCLKDEDCAGLEDGNACNGTLFCDVEDLPFKCKVDTKTVVACPVPEGLDAVCKQAACEPVSGECYFAPDHDGYLCEDGNKCTAGDSCLEGECAAGQPVVCNDGNSCTDDECAPDTGCLHFANSEPCTDGDACTLDDLCIQGQCVGGPPLGCDDGNPCTDDLCDQAVGCINEPHSGPCDDGNECTVGDHCVDGWCAFDAPAVCDDGNGCTDDSCDPLQGCINSFNQAPCNDGNMCTLGDHCAQGACVNEDVLQCSDSNPCTNDSCNPDAGCVYQANSLPCDDGNMCTEGDHCDGGWCVIDAVAECDDGNGCTDDACDPGQGCVHTVNEAPCDDGDTCTTGDHCHLGGCISADVMLCNDSNPCTDDSCAPDAGCVFFPNTLPCDDGSACTTGDTCTNGACVPGEWEDCDDENPCTDDTCSTQQGCIHSHNQAFCNDGEACTLGDMCAQGVCVGGAPANCNDGNPCTDDSCEPGVGCVQLSNQSLCEDGDACTTGEVCQDGECGGGQPVTCNDGNVCTDDSCEPDSGCVFAPNLEGCSDGDVCTQDDHCDGGECVSSDPLDCDDQNPCTDDACSADAGCIHGFNSKLCDDQNACTTVDQCDGGECVGSVPLVCEDGEKCTEDSCDPDSGCVFDPTVPCCGNNVVEPPEECDDGNDNNNDACPNSCSFSCCSSTAEFEYEVTPGVWACVNNGLIHTYAENNALCKAGCTPATNKLVQGLQMPTLPEHQVFRDWYNAVVPNNGNYIRTGQKRRSGCQPEDHGDLYVPNDDWGYHIESGWQDLFLGGPSCNKGTGSANNMSHPLAGVICVAGEYEAPQP